MAEADDKETSLHTAARCGQLEEVRKLLKSKQIKVNMTNSNNHTPLHLACAEGHLELVDMLAIEFRADIGVLDKDNKTPLIMAASSGHVQIVFLLIILSLYPRLSTNGVRVLPTHNPCKEQGHIDLLEKLVYDYHNDPTAKESTMILLDKKFSFSDCDKGYLSLFLAASFGLKDLIYNLSKEHVSLLTCKGFRGLTILHPACFGGNLDLVESLVSEHGLDPLARDEHGFTTLHYAAIGGHDDTIRHLVSRYNIDPESKCDCNVQMSPLAIAAMKGHKSVVCIFLEEFNVNPRIPTGTVINCACTSSNSDLVDWLISKHDLNPIAQGYHGLTPLHLATTIGCEKTVRLLITKYKADTMITNNDNLNPLEMATLAGHNSLVYTLVKEFHFDPSSKGHNGKTLIHHACEEGHAELLEDIIPECSLDFMAKDDDGNTPLHIAVMFGHVETVTLLVNKFLTHRDVESIDKGAILEKAIMMGCTPIVNLLINELQCDTSIKGANGRSLVHVACERGSNELLESLITDHKMDPMGTDDEGNTPLHLASSAGHEDTVRLLVTKYKVDTEKQNHEKLTPLEGAMIKGHSGITDALIDEFGCVPSENFKDLKGRTLLHQASIKGDIIRLESLITEHSLNQMAKDNDGNTPLHLAALSGNKEVVKLLVKKYKADAETKNNDNYTPLEMATLRALTTIVQLLLEDLGCRPTTKGFKGRTLLHLACIAGSNDLVEYLISVYHLNTMARDDDENTPLHIAAAAGHQETVRLLVKKYEADIETKNIGCFTPVGLAAVNHQKHVIDTFIKEFNCSPTIVDDNGNTLLHLAYVNVLFDDVADYLISEHGLDPMARNNYGNTPLHTAAISGCVESVRLLITKYGADVSSRNNYNNYPIHEAAINGKTNVVHTLIREFQVNPSIKGYKGRTLLHQACHAVNESASLIETLLLDYKIPLLMIDEDGNTPLHTAALLGQAECVHKLLYQFTASVCVKNKDGKTARDILKTSNSPQLVQEFDRYYQVKSNSDIQAKYLKMYQLSTKHFVGQKCLTRLFVMGHPGSGKSTLIETLKREGIFEYLKYTFIGTTSSASPHTAGIVPSIYDSSQYGRLIFYDFAGDPEYYSSHAAILETLKFSEGANLYLIVSNLDESNSLITKRYGYWLSFITYNVQNRSVILPIGSHADKLTDSSLPADDYLLAEKLTLLNRISDMSSCTDLKIETSIALDCRGPSTMTERVKDLVQKTALTVPQVELCLETSTLLGLLKLDFANVAACSYMKIITHIKDTGIPLPTDPNLLHSLLVDLHNMGLLMIIEKESDPLQNHLVILKVSTLITEVHSKLFSDTAKAELARYTDPLQLSVGIIPEPLLKVLLPEYITKECLLKLQYCQEIENVHVEEDHTLTRSRRQYSSSQKPDSEVAIQSLLFFPALCQLKRDDIILFTNTTCSSKCAFGWYAKCEEDRFDYFPSRFLHVLTVRLALSFALKQCLPATFYSNPLSSKSIRVCADSEDDSTLAELHRVNPRCHVWTTGLHWIMENGVEVYVDMNKEAENTELVVVAKSDEECMLECATTLHKVIQKVIEAKVEFCHSIMPTVHLLDPDKLKNTSFTNAVSVPHYTLSDVQAVLAKGNKQAVSVDGYHSSSPYNLMCLTRWTMSYWNLFFPMDTNKVYNAVSNSKWKLFGINLGVRQETLDTIESDYSKANDRKTKMIQEWMSGESRPTWSTLVKALSSPSIALDKMAEEISTEHNVPLQDQIFNTKGHPDPEFLQLFASVVGSRWQCLASLLSLTSEDIVSIKRETRGAEPSKQALTMLQKWASSETATYSQLRERLCTLSVFHI